MESGATRENCQAFITQCTLLTPMHLHVPQDDATFQPQQEDVKALLCPVTAQPMGDYHDLDNEVTIFKFSFFSIDSLFITSFPNSIKEYFSTLFLCT